jgi:predicted nucleic acid-binding protein
VVDVVIDTDVASVIQKARAPEWVHRHVVGARVWLTFVAVGELWKWAGVRSWAEANRSQLGAWIAARPVLPYDAEIARTWARMSAGAQLRGRPRPRTTPGSPHVASGTACRS